MWGALIGALVGWVLAGQWGALVGAILGLAFSSRSAPKRA